MILLLKLPQFLISGISFLEKKVNMIMDGYFVKIIYSDDCMTMNGIYLEMPLILSSSVHKNMLSIDTVSNKDIIYKLSVIEKQLIQCYMLFFGISNKVPSYYLKQQLQSGYIKFYRDYESSKSNYYIKISGIWETTDEIGITYKIIEC